MNERFDSRIKERDPKGLNKILFPEILSSTNALIVGVRNTIKLKVDISDFS